MWEHLFSIEAAGALLTLTFLEIVLGIDNIIFISLAAGKLEEKYRKKAIKIGLALAMILRILLLLGITYLIGMQRPWINFEGQWMSTHITGQSLILFLGGLFLMYKSTKEIHEKVDNTGHQEDNVIRKGSSSLSNAIVQITVINIVFSFDSILTAIGMTNGIDGALPIMIIAVVLSVIIMMLFANPVGEFVNKHPSLQILGLAFLLLIGFMLIAEAAHLSHTEIFGAKVGTVPKGYLYFAIAFSLLVEFLNFKMRKNHDSSDD